MKPVKKPEIFRTIYLPGSTAYETGSILLVAAATNMLVGLLPSPFPSESGMYPVLDPHSRRVIVMFSAAFVGLFSGIAMFMLGRAVARIEEGDLANQRSGNGPLAKEPAKEILDQWNNSGGLKGECCRQLFLWGVMGFVIEVALFTILYTGRL